MNEEESEYTTPPVMNREQAQVRPTEMDGPAYIEWRNKEALMVKEKLAELQFDKVQQSVRDACRSKGKKGKRKRADIFPTVIRRSERIAERCPAVVDEEDDVSDGEFLYMDAEADEAVNMDEALVPDLPPRKRGSLKASNHWPFGGPVFNPENKMVFNNKGQPIGDNLSIFQDVLSTRMFRTDLSLAFDDWRKVPLLNPDKSPTPKMRVWLDMQKTFGLLDNFRDDLFRTMAARIRCFKVYLRKKYFDYHNNLEEAIKSVPVGINAEDWKWLCNCWTEDKFKEISEKNKQRRAERKDIHCSGPVPYALVSHKMEKELNREPARHEIYCVTHTKDGKPINDEAARIMAAFFGKIAGDPNCNPNQTFSEAGGNDIYARAGVFKEVDGRIRGMGMGATRSKLLRKGRYQSSDELEQLRAENLEMKSQNQALSAQVKALAEKFDSCMRSQQGQSSGRVSNLIRDPIRIGYR